MPGFFFFVHYFLACELRIQQCNFHPILDWALNQHRTTQHKQSSTIKQTFYLLPWLMQIVVHFMAEGFKLLVLEFINLMLYHQGGCSSQIFFFLNLT